MAQRGENRFVKRLFGTLAIVALLGVAVLFWMFLTQGTPGEAASPQPTASVTPQPSHSHGSDEEGENHEPHPPAEEPGACTNVMDEKEYAQFLDRVYQFEVAYQMQPSKQRLIELYPFVTDSFLETQKGDYPDTVENVTVEVDEKSTVGCTMNSDEVIIASITPIVTVVEHHDDGSQTVLHGPMTMPNQHFTQWVLIDNTWYVKLDQK